MSTQLIKSIPTTMSSREIAELTGKEHRNVTRDIEVQLTELMGEGGLLKFEHTYRNEQNGQEYREYHLPKRECLIVVSGYSVELRARIIDRWMELETQATIEQASKAKPTADSLTLKHRQAKIIAHTWLSMAKLFGTDEPMARAIAADQVRQQTGIDPTPLLSSNAVQEAPMTPTELGKRIDMSARKLNALLALQGFQEKHQETEDWIPTDKGKPYCTCNPFKSPHSHHTGYRTLWYRTILNVLNCDQHQAA